MMQVCVCLIYDGLQVIQTNIDGALEYRSFSLVVTVALASRSLGPKSCLSPSNCCRKWGLGMYQSSQVFEEAISCDHLTSTCGTAELPSSKDGFRNCFWFHRTGKGLQFCIHRGVVSHERFKLEHMEKWVDQACSNSSLNVVHTAVTSPGLNHRLGTNYQNSKCQHFILFRAAAWCCFSDVNWASLFLNRVNNTFICSGTTVPNSASCR